MLVVLLALDVFEVEGLLAKGGGGIPIIPPMPPMPPIPPSATAFAAQTGRC